MKHPEDYPFDFRHLGILFKSDHNMDGQFSFEDLSNFVIWVQMNLQSVQMYEFKSELQARTIAELITHLKKKDGERTIISWVHVSISSL